MQAGLYEVETIEEVPSRSEVAEQYRFSPGDQVTVSVWRNEELTQTVTIDWSGSIYLPLIGSVAAAGLTVEELRVNISEKLNKYYRDPVVSITDINSVGEKYYTLGKFNSVGSHDLSQRLTLFEAVMEAGGPSDDADEKVLLVRKEHDAIRVVSGNMGLADITEGTFNVHSIYVQPGDVIYLPPSEISDVESFALSLSNILLPILDIQRAIILWPSLIEAIDDDSSDLSVAF